MKENLNYKVKIDMPNVIELISETFDGVLDHMFPGMLVFGGALRDIIAGFGLHHDLDIAASHSEGRKFIQYLETSSKWVEKCVVDQYKERARIMEDKISNIVSPHSMANGALDLDRNLPYITKPKFSNYGNVQSVRTFINFSGRKLQIIIGKSDLFTLKEHPPVLIVKNVDFICCGIMMDIDGNVYEVVEGAKNDCVKKVLRINKDVDIEFHNLDERIKKLSTRGWKSEINLTQIRQKRARLKKIVKRNIDDTGIHEHTLSSGMVQIVINTSKIQIFKRCNNSSAKTLDLFYNILKNHTLTKAIHSCEVNTSYNTHHHIIITVTCTNTEIIISLKKVLLGQIDLSEPKKKNRPLFSETITKFTARPSLYTFKYDIIDTTIADTCSTGVTTACIQDGKVEWADIERGEDKVRKSGLEKILEKEKLTLPKTKLMEDSSNLKITKKEKMKIEYGSHLTRHPDLISYPSLDDLSKHFIEPLKYKKEFINFNKESI